MDQDLQQPEIATTDRAVAQTNKIFDKTDTKPDPNIDWRIYVKHCANNGHSGQTELIAAWAKAVSGSEEESISPKLKATAQVFANTQRNTEIWKEEVAGNKRVPHANLIHGSEPLPGPETHQLLRIMGAKLEPGKTLTNDGAQIAQTTHVGDYIVARFDTLPDTVLRIKVKHEDGRNNTPPLNFYDPEGHLNRIFDQRSKVVEITSIPAPKDQPDDLPSIAW